MARRKRGEPPLTRLQGAREELRRTQEQVVRYILKRRNEVPGLPQATEQALFIMISRWENGHVEVTEPGYQRLFREFYGRTNEELGFPSELLSHGVEELRDRLVVARSIDTATLDMFQRQVNDLRNSDQRFGAVVVLEQLNGLVRQMESVRAFSVRTQHRERLAAVLTDARTLAGWTALDRGSQLQAWQYHEDAKVSAREADSPYLLAHAAAQQAVILLDIGEPAAAVELLEYARYVAENRAPSLLRTWLAAAHGEGLAAAGFHHESVRAFDDAEKLLSSDPVDPEMPFLLLNDGHLARWRGSALLRLGNQDAINQLESAARELENSPRSAVRGEAGMYVDLAFAYAAAGDSRGAQEYARKAKQLASRIGSDRQRQRLASLELPVGSASHIA
ncbi:tetratricopeptide repeat protein [Umezawaea endophytica]|uniref:Tetratricopeptide repeat protein n=1 Tax=Umezawaea endophytica TaxID=1654476 RepID=A0A9X3AFF2_9PSEU|nr:tetratricopeptide repeat protein [Umezawaea endophytica]MCS7478186.1 tetratricopeptide repeat protein [Umezawaea endophytica]